MLLGVLDGAIDSGASHVERLNDYWDSPAIASTRAALVEELLHWRIVTDDDLPLGDYVTERAAHDWDWALGGSVVAGA